MCNWYSDEEKYAEMGKARDQSPEVEYWNNWNII